MKALHDKGLTLAEIGKAFDITRERVRQILDRHFNIRRKELSTPASEGIDRQSGGE